MWNYHVRCMVGSNTACSFAKMWYLPWGSIWPFPHWYLQLLDWLVQKRSDVKHTAPSWIVHFSRFLRSQLLDCFCLFIKERACPTKTYTLKPWIVILNHFEACFISGQPQILENTSCCRSQTTQVVGVMVMGGTEKKVQRHAGRKSASWLMWWLNQQKWWLNEIWLDLYHGIFLTYVYNRIIPSP